HESRGQLYYLHTGRVARGALRAVEADRKSFTESGLWQGDRSRVEWPDGASRDMYVLGQLNHDSLIPTLAAYVHSVTQYRLLVMGQKRRVRAKQTLFLSHSNADGDRQWCEEFVALLRARGRDVWYDQSSLVPGMLAEQLSKQIADRDGFVIAWSRNALKSPF